MSTLETMDRRGTYLGMLPQDVYTMVTDMINAQFCISCWTVLPLSELQYVELVGVAGGLDYYVCKGHKCNFQRFKKIHLSKNSKHQ